MNDPPVCEGFAGKAPGSPSGAAGGGFLGPATITVFVSIVGLNLLVAGLAPFTGLLAASAAAQLVFFLALPAAVAAAFGAGLPDLMLAAPARGSRAAGALFVPAALALVLQYQIFQETHLFKSHEALNAMYEAAFGLGVTPPPVIYLSVALVPAVAEEFLFRGFLLPAVARRAGAPVAVIATSVLFAAVHPPLAMPPILLIGLLLGAITAITGSLLPAILTHFANNVLAVAFLLDPGAAEALDAAIPGSAPALAACACAVVLVAVMGIRGRGRLENSRP